MRLCEQVERLLQQPGSVPARVGESALNCWNCCARIRPGQGMAADRLAQALPAALRLLAV